MYILAAKNIFVLASLYTSVYIAIHNILVHDIIRPLAQKSIFPLAFTPIPLDITKSSSP